MTSNHRIITGGDDWMRDVERRIGRQERRPSATDLNSRLGPGISQRALKVVDWNDPEILRNGWFTSDAPSVNSPDPNSMWLGTCTIAPDGHGTQVLWSHGEALIVGLVREFHWHDGTLLPTFSAWVQFTGGSGGAPAGTAGGDLAGTYPNPTIGVGKVTATHILDSTITDVEVAAANKDGAAGSPSLRTLGAGALQAAAGDHTHAGSSVPASRTLTAGSGLTGGGDLSADQTFAVGGTTNRINVYADTVDIAGTYVGQMSINTVGVLTTGGWESNAVEVAYGGTGATSAVTARANLVAAGGRLMPSPAISASFWSDPITHNLGTDYVAVAAHYVTTGEVVELDWRRHTVNQVQIRTDVDVGAGALRLVITSGSA